MKLASEPMRGGKAGHHDAGDEQQGEPIGLSGHVARRRDCQSAPAEDQTGQNDS